MNDSIYIRCPNCFEVFYQDDLTSFDREEDFDGDFVPVCPSCEHRVNFFLPVLSSIAGVKRIEQPQHL
jgi:NAD-dependent SIR2 family protein deacetylase